MSDENSLVLSEQDLLDMQKVPACNDEPIGFLEYVAPTQDMHFGQALVAMKAGKRVRRAGWLGWQIAYYFGSGRTLMSETALSPSNRYDELGAVLAVDLLATDWQVMP